MDGITLAIVLLVALTYFLGRSPTRDPNVIGRYAMQREIDEEEFRTHWADRAGRTRVNRSLLDEVRLDLRFRDRPEPPEWYGWRPEAVRRRDRQRKHEARMVARGILPMRQAR